MRAELQVSVPTESYPCLKKATNPDGAHCVVLFIDSKYGTVVQCSEGGPWRLGDHFGCWDQKKFTALPVGSRVVITQ